MVAMKIRIIMLNSNNFIASKNHIAVAISDQITAIRFFFKIMQPQSDITGQGTAECHQLRLKTPRENWIGLTP